VGRGSSRGPRPPKSPPRAPPPRDYLPNAAKASSPPCTTGMPRGGRGGAAEATRPPSALSITIAVLRNTTMRIHCITISTGSGEGRSGQGGAAKATRPSRPPPPLASADHRRRAQPLVCPESAALRRPPTGSGHLRREEGGRRKPLRPTCLCRQIPPPSGHRPLDPLVPAHPIRF
jgi:hypothetical protein